MKNSKPEETHYFL